MCGDINNHVELNEPTLCDLRFVKKYRTFLTRREWDLYLNIADEIQKRNINATITKKQRKALRLIVRSIELKKLNPEGGAI